MREIGQKSAAGVIVGNGCQLKVHVGPNSILVTVKALTTDKTQGSQFGGVGGGGVCAFVFSSSVRAC